MDGKETSAYTKGRTCLKVYLYLCWELKLRIRQPFPCVVTLVAASVL